MGALFRDHDGRVLAAARKHIRGASAPVISEAMAVLFGLRVALDLCFLYKTTVMLHNFSYLISHRFKLRIMFS